MAATRVVPSTSFDHPRSASVVPLDPAGVRALCGIAGEAGPANTEGGPAVASYDEVAILRVTVRTATPARRAGGGGLFPKSMDLQLTVQLVRAAGADDTESVLAQGVEVGPELSTSVKRKRRSSTYWGEDFGLRWLRDPAQYAQYAVVITLKDVAKEPRDLGYTVVRFSDLPISVDDAGLSVLQGEWILRGARDGPGRLQATGSVELDFTFEPPPSYVPPVSTSATTVTTIFSAAVASAGPAIEESASSRSGGDVSEAHTSPSDDSSEPEPQSYSASVEHGRSSSSSEPSDLSLTARCPLPPGWVMCRTKKGRPFFIDHVSQVTTFRDPREMEQYSSFYAQRMHDQMKPRFSSVVGMGEQEEEIPLPPNWDERVDVDGRKFYVDHSKKRTTWVHPVTGKKSKRPESLLGAGGDGNSATTMSPAFAEKLRKFRGAIRELRGPGSAKQNIMISRGDVLATSLSAVMKLGPRELQRTPYVTFHGERGLDYGGLQREWFYLLSHEIFNPAYGLFEYSSGATYILQINPNSGLANPGHLQYFRFAGRILGMAVLHGGHIDAFFIKPLYKLLLGQMVTVNDMKSVDPEYYTNLLYVLENDPAPLALTFAVDEEGIGSTTSIDLKEGGSQIDVTEENRAEYVQLVCERRFIGRCSEQIYALKQGFNDVIPPGLLNSFDENELEVMIGGNADIDVQDWRKSTVYSGGYTSYSPTVQWFWEAVLSYTPEQRARLLQFATASSRVPMNGFAELQGSNGPQRFNIRQWGCIADLPRAHTCFNRIDLPAYNSYKLVRDKLLIAIENAEGFDGVD